MPHSILIVEDDLTFATMLKTWLGKKGFSVDTASSNARARKQLDAQPYDLVLSDLRLPDQDGIFLLSWMKEQKYNIPLIIMTGYADIQSAVQAIKHGASDYISKPIQPDEHPKATPVTPPPYFQIFSTHQKIHSDCLSD